MSDLVLYNYFRSSTSYRVRLALHWKGLSFEYRSVHLLNHGGEQHRPEYRELNPAGEVPTLSHNGKHIGQSMAILQYLDEVFPQKRIFAAKPLEKAQILQFCEGINCAHSLQNLKVLQFMEKELGSSPADKNRWLQEWIGRILESSEKMLEKTSGAYAFGGEITAADFFLVPQMFSAQRFNVNVSVYPTLARVTQNCLRLDAFEKAHPFRQIDTPSELKNSAIL
ncbi:MAG: maleylacetoacetate isomerase [Bdellovibrio sp. CG10_big_fil_rev_8_21_14_0_10_47_8]|nr:MAG: maleylacetoacetate isomerase [Bdellovibrio sp. CG10_big_fil_rev_8_21_14_0_10_47_8]